MQVPYWKFELFIFELEWLKFDWIKLIELDLNWKNISGIAHTNP